MRLIDADALMESAKGYSPIQGELCGYYDFAWLVNAEPTVDATEVVRCNWIPISERLPEDGRYVPVIVSGRVGNVRLDRAVELAEFSMDEGWILEMWPDWENPTVTHWMPLPEPPKEDHHEA